MVIEIPLSKNAKFVSKSRTLHTSEFVTIVSDEDADLANLSWNVKLPRREGGAKYAADRNSVRLHRIIMERMIAPLKLQKGQVVDHINLDGLDNRRENLRVATTSQNKMNGRLYSTNTSGYKGVSLNKRRNKYTAHISINHKKHYLGAFDTAKEAYDAYCNAAQEHYGEFAGLD